MLEEDRANEVKRLQQAAIATGAFQAQSASPEVR
jgi:hypothetical protein